jgi:integrase
MRYTYGVYTGYVEKLPTQDLQRAGEIRDFILKNIPIESAKRFITRLSACCAWAVESDLIHKNPFAGMAKEIKIPKSASEDYEIDPFTASERDAILDAIATDRFCPKASGFRHSYYLPLLTFLFKTGCRPSEAIALEWAHITEDLRRITFQQRVISTRSGRKITPGLKSGQKRRSFPCNSSLRELLQSIRPEEYTLKTLVFPSPEGLLIDTNHFRNRIWKRVLEGLGLRYRKLYQTRHTSRHTFITLALESVGENGERLDAKDIAHLVGNSPEGIYQHYAGKKRELFVPEF